MKIGTFTKHPAQWGPDPPRMENGKAWKMNPMMASNSTPNDSIEDKNSDKEEFSSGKDETTEDEGQEEASSQDWLCSTRGCDPIQRVWKKGTSCYECIQQIQWQNDHKRKQSYETTSNAKRKKQEQEEKGTSNKAMHISNGNGDFNDPVATTEEAATLPGTLLDAQGQQEYITHGRPWIWTILHAARIANERDKRDIKDIQQELARRNRATTTHPRPEWGDNDPQPPYDAIPAATNTLNAITQDAKTFHIHIKAFEILYDHSFERHVPNEEFVALPTLDNVEEISASQEMWEAYTCWEQNHFELIDELCGINKEVNVAITQVNIARGNLEDARQQAVAQFQRTVGE